jgi:hypothetical protein
LSAFELFQLSTLLLDLALLLLHLLLLLGLLSILALHLIADEGTRPGTERTTNRRTSTWRAYGCADDGTGGRSQAAT